MKKIAHFVLLLLLIASPLSVGSAFAAEEPAEAIKVCPPFGKETVKVITSVPTIVVSPGATLVVKTSLANLTDLPLSGGALSVKLVADALAEPRFEIAEGSIFGTSIPAKDLYIPARTLISSDFSYTLPEALPKGDYTLQISYVSLDESIIDDPFHTLGINTSIHALSIDDSTSWDFAFIDPASLQSNGDKIAAVAINPATSGTKAIATWRIYSLETLTDRSLVASASQEITLDRTSRYPLAFEMKDFGHSRYIAELELVSNGVRSYARTLAEGTKGEALIKFSGIAPRTAEQSLVYVCGTNAFSDDETARELKLTVASLSGKIVDEIVYPIPRGVSDFQILREIQTPSNGAVLAASVVSENSAQTLVLKTYRCEDMGVCRSQAFDMGELFALTLLAAGTGGLIAIRYYLRRRKQRTLNEPINPFKA